MTRATIVLTRSEDNPSFYLCPDPVLIPDAGVSFVHDSIPNGMTLNPAILDTEGTPIEQGGCSYILHMCRMRISDNMMYGVGLLFENNLLVGMTIQLAVRPDAEAN